MAENAKTQAAEPVLRYVSFEELLEKEGCIVYTNVGTSMMPLLRQRRDIIEIHRKEPGRCKKYDVVLYKRGNKYILHRIIRVTPDGYVIAGDHNTFKEYDITDEKILGVMTRVIRDGKSVTADSLPYKIYYHIWVDFYPVRVFILRTKGRARALAKKVLKALGLR